jgi:ABC-type sugar transport system substrate-binding protein
MLAVSVAAACMAALAASSLAHAADMDKIGLGLPLSTSPFWQSYNIILGSLMVAGSRAAKARTERGTSRKDSGDPF